MSAHTHEEQANEVAKRLGLTVKAAYKGYRCPKWCDGNHVHGDLYRVTIQAQRMGGFDNAVSFDYWNSLHDKADNKRPTTYDILACVSSDMSCPTDPDEVAAEFGEMKPSQAIAIAAHAAKLQAFFTKAEQAAISEIA